MAYWATVSVWLPVRGTGLPKGHPNKGGMYEAQIQVAVQKVRNPRVPVLCNAISMG